MAKVTAAKKVAKNHEAQPNRIWEGPKAFRCALCGQPILEAVYVPGWVHAVGMPHPFAPFVYSDGVKAMDHGCLDCGKLKGNAIHPSQADLG